MAAKHPRNSRSLHRAEKNGLGRAYIAGFKWALERNYEFIFEMDGDFSHNPDDVPMFIEATKNADLVLGSRYKGGIRVINWPLRRLMLSRSAGKYVMWVTGMPFTDPTGGYKCFRRRALQAINLDAVQSNGYSFQIEMTHISSGAGDSGSSRYQSFSPIGPRATPRCRGILSPKRSGWFGNYGSKTACAAGRANDKQTFAKAASSAKLLAMISLIIGTNRPGSNTRKVVTQLEEFYAEFKVPLRVLDLAQLPPEIFSPSSYAEKPKAFHPFADAVLQSDGLHVVTPEYNGGIPGILKYFIDMLKFPESFRATARVFHRRGGGHVGCITAGRTAPGDLRLSQCLPLSRTRLPAAHL